MCPMFFLFCSVIVSDTFPSASHRIATASLLREPAAHIVHKIPCPVLYVNSEDDVVCPASRMTALAGETGDDARSERCPLAVQCRTLRGGHLGWWQSNSTQSESTAASICCGLLRRPCRDWICNVTVEWAEALIAQAAGQASAVSRQVNEVGMSAHTQSCQNVSASFGAVNTRSRKHSEALASQD